MDVNENQSSQWACDEVHHHLEGPSTASSSCLIDNSSRTYVPVRLKCGILAMCEPHVLTYYPGALGDLNRDFTDCLAVLPPNLHGLILRTRVWVNVTFSIGARTNPKTLNHTAAHHHESWLFWSRDRPDKKLGIEIYNCVDYQRMRLHWNGCGLILHELTHLIHQMTLPSGLDNECVKTVYERAKASEKYEQVLRRDWAGKDVDCDLAYAMVDHREFFAEISVAFLARGYSELDKSIHSKMEKASPAIVAPTVQTNILQNRDQTQKFLNDGKLLNVRYTGRLWHCNKFYPFTRGQLKSYDFETYSAIEQIWIDIAKWKDPQSDSDKGCCISFWNERLPRRPDAVEVMVPSTVDL